MTLKNKFIEHEFLATLEQGIRIGTLTLTTPSGETHVFKGETAGVDAAWTIHNAETYWAIGSRGDIGLGETYTAGLWDTPDLEVLFTSFIENMEYLERYAHGHFMSKIIFALVNNVFRRNSVKGSTRNIRQHYDVGNAFYKLWLDPSMTYSSAYFANDNTSLEQAQKQKYQRLLQKIGSGRENILEIGCGWGGFAEEAAANGHHVTGITISQQQHAFASERLGNKADIQLKDYRRLSGKFSAIASIEMFEAVGKKYWPQYFQTLKNSLQDDGVAMIQTITIQDALFKGYTKRGDYIRHYVFPGGLLPSVERFKAQAEKAGLACRDVFLFGQDYARTLREWLVSFNKAEPAIRALGYDEPFLRSWRLYLAMCAASFACSRTDVMQVELVHA